MRSQEEELAKHSKKLTAISFVIIVFVLGGGQFNQQPEYFSGLIQFENIYVIPITVFVVFLFYWYRYWVWQRKPIQYSKNQFYNSLKEDTKFRNYFREKSKEDIKSHIDDSKEIGGRVWEGDEPNQPIKAEYDPGIHKKRGFFAKEFSTKALDNRGGIKGNIEITLDWKRYYHFLRIKVKCNFFNKEYAYRVLPFWMALTALFCMIYAIIKGTLVV